MSASTAQPEGTIVGRRAAHALIVTVTRPSHANAYTQAMLADLHQHLDAADADPAIRAIVVTGDGDRSFCAGADRQEITTRDWRSVLTLASARVFQRLRDSRCVTIAAINGAAVGGGMELALACDLRLAVPQARFWLPEPEFGLLPAAGGIRLLPREVGPLRTRELILGGAVWTAEEALKANFLTEIAAPAALWDRVQIWIDRIAVRDIEAIRLAKQVLASGAGGDTTMDRLAQSLLVRHQRSRD